MDLIGLSTMGRPMSKDLLKAGYELMVFDPYTKAAMEDVVSCGAKAVASNAEVALQ